MDEGDTTSSQGSSPNVGEPASSTGGSAGSSSGTLWAEFLPEMQRQQVTSRQQNQELQYAEPSLATFEYISQVGRFVQTCNDSLMLRTMVIMRLGDSLWGGHQQQPSCLAPCCVWTAF